MSEYASFCHIDGMVLCCQIEAFVELERRKRFLFEKELIGFGPGRFSLIRCIITSWLKRKGRVIDEGIELFLDVICKMRRIGSGFVQIFESLLNWNDRHRSYLIKYISISNIVGLLLSLFPNC